MAELEGKTLDRYKLRSIVGKGGMANVYEGYDTLLERNVAVKIFKRDDEELLRRFIREARVMDPLRNEHLVPIYDAGEGKIDGMPWYYIVMPFMQGGTLRSRIRRFPLTLTQACRYLRDIADALDYIHRQGIIHRDIKSSNVLLDAEGRCYLTDFGIARLTTDATQATSTGLVLGTVDYIAPELFEPHSKANQSSDLYSLGVLLYEMATGRLPFSSESQVALVAMHMTKPPPPPSLFNSTVSPQVEGVMLKALAKRPELRYGSATELAQAFCRAVVSTSSPFSVSTELSPHPAIRETPSPVPAVVHRTVNRTPVGPPITMLPSESRRGAVPPKPPPHRRSPIVAVVGLIVVLVLTIPIIYFLVLHGGDSNDPGGVATSPAHTATVGQTATPTPNLTATAQAALAATATAQAHATATVVAGVTATAQAEVTATAGVLQTATAGTPSYQDALNNANNPSTVAARWDQDGNCAFAPDGYHVKQNTGIFNLHGCRESANTYQNATITVDVVLASGHSGGLFFRFSTDFAGTYSGYLFEIDNTGRYKISVLRNGGQTTLQGWTASSALKKGYNVKNTLQVIVKNSTYLLYINGVFLKQIVDGTLTSGTIALSASATDATTVAVYSNLSVYPTS